MLLDLSPSASQHLNQRIFKRKKLSFLPGNSVQDLLVQSSTDSKAQTQSKLSILKSALWELQHEPIAQYVSFPGGRVDIRPEVKIHMNKIKASCHNQDSRPG